MNVVNFNIGGVPAVSVDATSNFTTDGIKFPNSLSWSVTFKRNAIVGGTPVYTVEVSNNEITWYDYNNLSTDVSLEDSVADDSMSFTFMRIQYLASGVSSGTLDVELNINSGI